MRSGLSITDSGDRPGRAARPESPSPASLSVGKEGLSSKFRPNPQVIFFFTNCHADKVRGSIWSQPRAGTKLTSKPSRPRLASDLSPEDPTSIRCTDRRIHKDLHPTSSNSHVLDAFSAVRGVLVERPREDLSTSRPRKFHRASPGDSRLAGRHYRRAHFQTGLFDPSYLRTMRS